MNDPVTFVLLHGAASDSWYWHLVAPGLRAAGHDVVAVDLPCEDEEAGLDAYTEAVVAAVGDRTRVVLVAQSLAGLVAPLVAARLPERVAMVVMVAAMVPAPGESGGRWWSATGQGEAQRALDLAEGRDPDAPGDPVVTYLHDVPEEIAAASAHHTRGQTGRVLDDPWPLPAWPAVPTRFLLCRDDRLFPADFLRALVRSRLGITPDELPCGHLPALARPAELTRALLSYVA
ncbi:pimeloyl-ACP methyl ester carboxylesterase [Actinocorallia herbida]|uniref:Pimeloyl-ACP methyl ester carboxylesterase n=1 Tax=Actinocorallia herbida TaxID=58109 RepID=A0A3N1D636_9ACTN|nr:alpha/beta hydrolase [Actinocorallia herbida]ROO88993.1 pimeloyl-ACP methyl ester carboxylesterase [Actinocorallia herbida]